MADPTGELFPDADAIRETLERQTRDALLKRLGPGHAPSSEVPDRPTFVAPAEREAERLKSRGIGFGLELVRAVLAGRKTQTRRVIRPLPDESPDPSACPQARPGELLYVREPWLRTGGRAGATLYAADETRPTGRRYRPGMYMPRDAARLWLRVTVVRAERLQAISPADLAAEGLCPSQTLAAVWNGFYTAPGERWEDDPWVWVIEFGVETP